MKNPQPAHLLFCLLAWLLTTGSAFGQSAAIRYQGRLTEAGVPANGRFDMQFKLFDTEGPEVGAQQGETKTHPAVAVANGVFAVTLDFGAAVFDGSARFLEIGVRPADSAAPYGTLAPRQQVASVPYAIQSLNAATAATALTVAGGSAVSSLNDLKDNVTLAAGRNVTITPNGNTLTIASSGELWSLTGTDASFNTGNVGIGTTTPASKLEIAAQDGLAITGFQPFLTLRDSSAGGARSRIQAASGDVTLFTESYLNGSNPSSFLKLAASGNVGIGKINPGSKLDVASETETAIVGRSTSSSGAGVYGESAQFNGVRGLAHNANHGGVVGVHDGGGIAVYGTGAVGVQGDGTSVGVYGRSTAGTAVHAEGNAVQARDKGGFVKAMAYIDPFLPADQYVVRCYNSQRPGNATATAPCGIQVFRTLNQGGVYRIDFGFNIEDRFISVTPQASYLYLTSPDVVTGMIQYVRGSEAGVVFTRDGNLEDSRFHIIVY